MNNLSYHPFPSPGGGLFCTPTDLVKFYRVLAAGGLWQEKRIISKAMVKETGTKQIGDRKETYGLGCVSAPDFFGTEVRWVSSRASIARAV